MGSLVFFVVPDGQGVVVLHEVPEGAVEVEGGVEVGELGGKVAGGKVEGGRVRWGMGGRMAEGMGGARRGRGQSALYLLESLEILHPLVDLTLHQKHHSFNKVSESEQRIIVLVDIWQEMLRPVYMVVGRIKVFYVDFGLADLQKRRDQQF